MHAKLAIIDEHVARIGSANLNNRSMGLDSECDVAIEAAPDSPQAEAIARLQHRLLAEHLGVEPAEVAEALASQGRLGRAVQALNAPRERHVLPLPIVEPPDPTLVELGLLDPDGPTEMERAADELVRRPRDRHSLRGVLLRLALVVTGLLALTALWRWGPLAELADPRVLQAEAMQLRGNVTVTAAVLTAFVVGGLVMFPVTVLILATGFLYGPVFGTVLAFAGALLSACVGFAAGALLGRHGLRRLLRGRLDRISRQIAHRGILSMTLIRLVPVAPFSLINLVAGASHLRFRDFVIGSVMGMAPGIVAICAFSGQVGEVLRDPTPTRVLVLVALAALIAFGGLFAWRRLVRWRTEQRA